MTTLSLSLREERLEQPSPPASPVMIATPNGEILNQHKILNLPPPFSLDDEAPPADDEWVEVCVEEMK
eukprot:CAMPEP_0182599950 /NCGR_PEP_ID=MMETSP1324-20130603/90741_1 /TAXON_ID=236786 /ORGANISM="Florenciella sp., Strain RCC1587" /LENGTH=67 /DNA_ID=CAMNT_0024817857 /DNA_START=35 /DNA_END=238 /DNA_ORIENTATION=+